MGYQPCYSGFSLTGCCGPNSFPVSLLYLSIQVLRLIFKNVNSPMGLVNVNKVLYPLATIASFRPLTPLRIEKSNNVINPRLIYVLVLIPLAQC